MAETHVVCDPSRNGTVPIQLLPIATCDPHYLLLLLNYNSLQISTQWNR